MAHISLYRRYRPDTFDKLIGQGHIVRTLVNQIKTGNISHAYLFTGTRGTGKTSVARIFAKAVNCDSPVNGSPCGKCESCRELANPNNMDIIEIDAASNNSVDEIRDLREKVKYPPVSAKYKVYIIDEVHMMTTGAFNALLKTLEEPPSHAVFILATTDVHKLPATILSRCMRFDFKLLGVAELTAKLKEIFDDIQKPYDDEAVALIAAAGEGSVRDSLSIADMCVAFCENKITYSDVLEVLGASDPHIVIDLVDAIVTRDAERALNYICDLSNYGKNIAVLSKDIARHVRDVLYIKCCTNSAELLKLPQDIFDKLKAVAAKTDTDRLLHILDLFSNMNAELRYSTQPRILVEAAIVRAITESGATEFEQRLRAVENRLKGAQIAPTAEKKTIDNAVVGADATALWAKTRQLLVGKDSYFALGFPMNNYKTVEFISDGVLKVVVHRQSDFSLLNDKGNKAVIEKKLSEVYGGEIKVVFETEQVVKNDEVDIADRLKDIFGADVKIVK